MALPRVGQIVYLDVKSEHLKGRYQCRIVDSSNSILSIETPMRVNSPIPVTFDVGVEFEVAYRAMDGAECRFSSKVVERHVRDIPVLEILKPKSSDIVRIQRREYLRVPLSESVDVTFVDAVTKKLVKGKGRTRDLSGGGMAILVDSTLPIHAEDVLTFTLRLPNEPQEVTGKGVALRVYEIADSINKKVISVRFIEISDQQRQRIVRCTFARQIEIRNKLGQ